MRVRVRFSFLLLNGLLFLLREGAVIATFYAACTLHELGHIAAIHLTGGRVSSLEFSGSGIIMTARQSSCGRLRDSVLVLLAGPAVNLLLYSVLTLTGRGGDFRLMNLAAGAFNLLPFSGLDGGALLELFITGSLHERGLRILLTMLRITAAVGLAVTLLHR